ncbi:MAG: efflux RND transporter periplasmic adaptor subunit [Pirellulales bacterium]|nr:efflux RND transporter periplasmic adaptor subunit [Pirellulales bacterium]
MTEESSPFGNIVRTVVALAILSVGVGGLAIMIGIGSGAAATAPVEEDEAPRVETAEVRFQRQGLDLDVDGVVVPRREIAVGAEVGGRVVEKAEVCEAGKYVRKGTLLLKIDPRDYQFEVSRLEKERDQAIASLREQAVEETNTKELIKLAAETLALKQREIARLEKLAERGAAYVTDSQMDAERGNELVARNAKVTLENQLRSVQTRRSRLEAALQLVQTRLDKANVDLDRTMIKAPIDGMIVKDFVEEDAYLAPGTIVATIEDVAQCDVRCNLRMEELYWIWNQGDQANMSEDATSARDYTLYPTKTTVVYTLGDREYSWEGVLTRYDGIGLDETTRTVPCIVVVKEPNKVRESGAETSQAVQGPRALVRGMYVQLIIHVQPRTALLQVPEDAIRPGNRVWRVRNGKLNTIRVRVVSVMNHQAVIETVREEASDGLRAGDHVVTSPMASVFDDMPVRVQLGKRP